MRRKRGLAQLSSALDPSAAVVAILTDCHGALVPSASETANSILTTMGSIGRSCTVKLCCRMHAELNVLSQRKIQGNTRKFRTFVLTITRRVWIGVTLSNAQRLVLL